MSRAPLQGFALLAVAILSAAACSKSAPPAGAAPMSQEDSIKAQQKADSLRRTKLGGRLPSDTNVPLEYFREVFRYSGGPRDPFASLVQSSDVRPTIEDLRLVSIAFDPRYGNSVAIVRETGNPVPHRLRRGSVIGRLHVIQIREREVVFQIEEFGFERQQVLTLSRPEVAP
jgi:hypothetical protein